MLNVNFKLFLENDYWQRSLLVILMLYLLLLLLTLLLIFIITLWICKSLN